ncbi:SPOR domain-containing protein [Candidatus Albibeggiatoa sp. nov. NOAA]|uniref:SPOR domain-containing protein n=1 Tax=Candidatus Albibeggiatoa sp. nov. NOAA TaxID=3162724 RepID=UPI0032F4685F|nr:SPOR domain-containing protein [Thiotrichaceae bacterium]
MAQNVRRPVSVSEPYDPKQRAVGGVVLALIMLLVYFFLQTLVTLSIPAGAVQTRTGPYDLGERLPGEQIPEALAPDVNGDVYIPKLPASMSQFVFLDIDGTPFGTNTEAGEAIPTIPIIGTHWVVQVASLTKHSQAESVVLKLKAEGIDMEIKKIGSWYTVRTTPQRTEDDAKQLKTQLRRFGYRDSLIKKIE